MTSKLKITVKENEPKAVGPVRLTVRPKRGSKGQFRVVVEPINPEPTPPVKNPLDTAATPCA